MGRTADTLYRSESDIARLEAMTTLLPDEARVRVTLRSGDVVEGTVVERPSMQVFENGGGEQGINATLRLDTSDEVPPTDVWLSDVTAVEHLDTH